MADYGSDTIDTGTLVINLVFLTCFFHLYFMAIKMQYVGRPINLNKNSYWFICQEAQLMLTRQP